MLFSGTHYADATPALLQQLSMSRARWRGTLSDKLYGVEHINPIQYVSQPQKWVSRTPPVPRSLGSQQTREKVPTCASALQAMSVPPPCKLQSRSSSHLSQTVQSASNEDPQAELLDKRCHCHIHSLFENSPRKSATALISIPCLCLSRSSTSVSSAYRCPVYISRAPISKLESC